MVNESVQKLLEENSGIRLDIGCGDNKQDGFVGIDIRELDSVDIVHDLEEFPWPLPDESVVLAVCTHVVEHIEPHGGVFMDFMNEAWRVLKPDAELAIIAPYCTSPGFYQDPTHCNPVSERTWAYFDPLETRFGGQLYRIYKPKPWKIKVNTWHGSGNLEAVLIKRREDDSYER